MKWKPLTSRGGVHPGEGDTSDDTFTEAQQERASLFFLQEGLLFAFAHETHNEATTQMKNLTQTQTPVSQELKRWAQLLNSDLNSDLAQCSAYCTYPSLHRSSRYVFTITKMPSNHTQKVSGVFSCSRSDGNAHQHTPTESIHKQYLKCWCLAANIHHVHCVSLLGSWIICISTQHKAQWSC